jgi:tetratricopeptide (TPR) repeat protein
MQTFERLADDHSTIEDTPQPKRRRRWPWYLLFYFLIILAISAVAYRQGRLLNQSQHQEQVALFLDEQFKLGIQDLQDGKYELARQRFEAILRYDPTYPHAEEKLIEVYSAVNIATITPTPRPTPTPDPSPPEQLFDQAKEALANGEWTLTITKLLVLRAKDPTYQSIEADGMMYIALRNRGMELINQGQMEEGLYDLSLAERFGPLDRDASFKRTLAEQYLYANSYYGLNWAKAAELFASLCQQGATIDSCPKYAEAAWKYGDLLILIEDPCGAVVQFEGSLMIWEDEILVPTATQAAEACEKATAPPPRPKTATPTPDGVSTEEPTATPTATPTP